jgi:hypothetical protein
MSTAELLHADWLLEGEREGHTVQRTLLYAQLMGELADQQQPQRRGAVPPENVISVDFEPRLRLFDFLHGRRSGGRRRHRG